MLRKLSALISLFLVSLTTYAQISDSVALRSIYSETLENSKAYNWLRDLTTTCPGRLAGSDAAAKAVEWAKKTMIEAGADSVYLQEVMVPHWVRGAKETGTIIEANGKKQSVPVIALGNSVGTPKEGITANIIEVHNFDELKALGTEKVKGKIVFYNHPFDEKFINTFEAYGEAVEYRWAGPSEAARYGAVGTIVRSMTNAQDDFPHTGAMHYYDSLPKLPCIAISTNGANLLSSIIRANKETKFYMQTNCQMLDSVKSYNVIGEIFGKSKRDEVIVVGGHLDSWDNCSGAHDDGAGVVQSIEILRTMKALKMTPERTIRVIAFMNEENGAKGGKTYAANLNGEKHVAAIESDAGAFLPVGFGLNMKEEKRELIRKWIPLFRPYGLWNFDNDGDGTDISFMEKYDIPCIGLNVNSQRYFDYHHAASDTIDKVNKRELLLGSASMAALAYLIAMHGL